MMQVVSILHTISIWSILLPLLIGIPSYRKLNVESRIIFFVVVIGAIPQLLRPFINDTALLWILYNWYTPIEFALYCSMFIIKTTSRFNRIFFYFSAFVFAFVSGWFIYSHNLSRGLLHNWVVVNNTIQICWVCVFLMEYYRHDEAEIETWHPFFWFLSGIAVYATCTIVVYGLWDNIRASSSGPTQLLNGIHHFFNIMLYIFFSIGLLKNRRPNKTD